MKKNPVVLFNDLLLKIAPYMRGIVDEQQKAFGDQWVKDFSETLDRMFKGEEHKLRGAIEGYIRYTMKAKKLQLRFEQERVYRPQSFDQVVENVYHERQYLFGTYFPGILIGHYLWRDHYLQYRYFLDEFVPLIASSATPRFCDIGVGTGFFTRLALAADERIEGFSYEISEHALAFTKAHLEAFGLAERWQYEVRNITDDPPEKQWPFIVSVEVLEHLEDPVKFLGSLRKMLLPGGKGFISAALTAPTIDHIYLYESCDQIAEQLKQAGFAVLDFIEQAAFEAPSGQTVPRVGAFIVN